MSADFAAGYNQGCDDYFRALGPLVQPTWSEEYREGYRLGYIEANVYSDMANA